MKTLLFLTALFTTIISVNGQNKKEPQLTFTYDDSGNQTKVTYCKDADHCTTAIKSVSRSLKYKLILNNIPPINKTTANKTNTDINTQISVSPNPTTGRITITIKSVLLPKVASVSICDAHGSSLYNSTAKVKKVMQANLSGKPSGFYFLKVILKNGKTVSKPIIKK